MEVLLGIMIGMAGLVGVWLFLQFLSNFLLICRPNEIIVFSGRSRRLADGSSVGYSVLQHGRRVRVPFIETATRMSVSSMTVHISISNAYSRGNIPLTVSAIANVKISTRPGVLDNAIERFLGRDREEVRRVAKETIEGALRGAIAKLTPEQVNEDRSRIVEALSEEAEEDLKKIGIQVDTLNIQSVTDEVSYLDSIGRDKIAAVLRDAEVAESDREREAERAIAEAEARGKVANEQAEAKIRARDNDLRRVMAELEAEARSEEERTLASAEEVRALAEVQLQEVRAELERLRLRAEEVLPADARRVADQLAAVGQAATIAAEGRAAADVLGMMTAAWSRAGDSAEDIFLIQQLEPLVQSVVDKLGDMAIHEVQLIDSGDGASLGKLAGAYPASVAAVLQSIGQTAGIPILDVLSRAPAAAGGAAALAAADPSAPPRARSAASPIASAFKVEPHAAPGSVVQLSDPLPEGTASESATAEAKASPGAGEPAAPANPRRPQTASSLHPIAGLRPDGAESHSADGTEEEVPRRTTQSLSAEPLHGPGREPTGDDR